MKQGETVSLDEMSQRVGADVAKIGMGKAKKQKWIEVKGKDITRVAENPVDENQADLVAFQKNPDAAAHDDKKLKEYTKRKHLEVKSIKSYKVTKGPNFALERTKLTTDITADMLRTGEWKN